MSTVKDNKAKSLLDSFYQALIRHSPRISRKKLRKSVEKQASVAAATTTTTKNSYSADQKPRPKSVYQFPDIVVDDYDYPGLSQSRHATQLNPAQLFNIWLIPISVSNGFGPIMRTGSSIRFQ